MCQQCLAALSVLIFTALALVNDQAAKHLLWTALELCENENVNLLHTFASCITNIS